MSAGHSETDWVTKRNKNKINASLKNNLFLRNIKAGALLGHIFARPACIFWLDHLAFLFNFCSTGLKFLARPAYIFVQLLLYRLAFFCSTSLHFFARPSCIFCLASARRLAFFCSAILRHPCKPEGPSRQAGYEEEVFDAHPWEKRPEPSD
jgi:hypothetical protein